MYTKKLNNEACGCVMLIMETRSLAQCAIQCSQHTSCIGFNIDDKNTTCELTRYPGFWRSEETCTKYTRNAFSHYTDVQKLKRK